MRTENIIVAIDGTAASGKGTLARRLAAHFGLAYLDTGLLYRYAGIEGLRQAINIDDPEIAGTFAETLVKTLIPSLLDNPDYRSGEAGPAASRIAKHPRVRTALFDLQRQFMREPPTLPDGSPAKGAVLDGRDIGTVIAPDATIKFFVTADLVVRAQRRFNELHNAGSSLSYGDILADMQGRDSRDAERAAAPMKPAPDAIAIDSSVITADEVFRLCAKLRRGKNEPWMTQPYVKCLALDIGGVFHGDSWETIFERDLAARYDLDAATVQEWGVAIWDDHAHKSSSEQAYWRDWSDRLGRPVDLDHVHALIDRHVWVDRSVPAIAESCIAHDIALCIVSNNTSFWYAQEMGRAGLSSYMDRIHPYISCDLGHPKTHANGGLARLARDYKPLVTLFIDDRADNIAAARALGMDTLLYKRDPAVELADVVLPLISV